MTSQFPKGIDIPLARWIGQLMDWVITHWGGLFDALGDSVNQTTMMALSMVVVASMIVARGLDLLELDMEIECSGEHSRRHDHERATLG